MNNWVKQPPIVGLLARLHLTVLRLERLSLVSRVARAQTLIKARQAMRKPAP